jgi:alkaline phosphatase
MDPRFRQPAMIPKAEETHSGEDVGVYANGPYSHVS